MTQPVHPLIPQVVRIGLRYLSGIVGGGAASVLIMSPQIEAAAVAVVATLIGVITEAWFARSVTSGRS